MIILLPKQSIKLIRDYRDSLPEGITKDAMTAAVEIWEAANGSI